MTDEPQVTQEEQEQPQEGLDVEALQTERDELFDRLQRLPAGVDNFPKRGAREAGRTIERANERLV